MSLGFLDPDFVPLALLDPDLASLGLLDWDYISVPTGGGAALTQDIDDTLSLSDTITSFGYGKGIGDTLTLSDGLSFVREMALADTLAISDSLAFAREMLLTEALSIADNIAANRGISVSVDDTLGIADQLGGFAFGRLLEETLALADALKFDREMTLADTLSLADAVAKTQGLSIQDTLTLTDAVAFAFQRSIDDTVSLSDFIDPVKTSGGGNTWEQNVDDTLALADAISFQRTVELVFADSVTMSDDRSRQLNGTFLTDAAAIEVIRKIILGRFGIF